MSSYPETLGALKRSPYGVPERALRSVKDEMRQNLLARLCNGGPLFAGVIGYEETVMPQIVNAILSRHNFILLGLRGQAKSRILRALNRRPQIQAKSPVAFNGGMRSIEYEIEHPELIRRGPTVGLRGGIRGEGEGDV